MRCRSSTCALLALSAAGCGIVLLPKIEPRLRPVTVPNAFGTFPTGLRAVGFDAPGALRVSLTVSYGAGEADDPEGKEGLAHLAEHLTFRARFDGAESAPLDSRLRALGAAFNGTTSADSTDFTVHVPQAAFTAAVELEALRMREPLAGITEPAFEAERRVVVAELRQREEENQGLQSESLEELALPGHPYGRRQTPESLARLTLDDVRAFCARHYAPSNAVVVASGPGVADALEPVLRRGFGGLATGEGAPRRPPERRRARPFPLESVAAHRAVKRGPVELPEVWMAWPVPGSLTGMTVQPEVLGDLLRETLGAALFGDERAGDAAVFVYQMEDVGLLGARVEVKRERDVEAIEEEIQNAVADARARSNLAARAAWPRYIVGAYDGLEAFPGPRVAAWVRATGRGDFLEGSQAQLAEALDKPLDRYAFTYLARKRASTLVVLPDPSFASLGRRAEVCSARFDCGSDGDPAVAGDVAQLIRASPLGTASRWMLSNGLEVVLVERHALPLVDVRLIVRTPPPQHAAALATSTLAFEASRASFRGLDLSRIGATSIVEMDRDRLVVGARAGSGNLVHVLDDIGRWAREHPLHAEHFLQAQSDELRALERAERRPRTAADAAFLSALYPRHAYGWRITPELLRASTVGQARDWIRAAVRPENATLIVVGDVEPSEARRDVQALFGGWRGQGALAKPRGSPPPEAPARWKVALVDRPGALQASLTVGFRLALLPEERAEAEALSWWLERRLDRELRGASAASYGAVTELGLKRWASALVIRTSIERQLAATTLQQLRAEMVQVQARGLEEADASRARWQIARMYDLRFATTRATADRLVETATLGLGPGYWDELAKALPGSSAAGMAAVARKIDPARAAAIVVGDAATLEPQLEAAGFEVERLR